MQILLSMFIYVTNAIFPSECVGCKKVGILLCEDCVKGISQSGKTERAFISAVFDYQSPIIRKAIWKFKYKNSRGFAKTFAPCLYDEIIGVLGNDLFISGEGKIMLVPVPLHKRRLRERGYNQSELLVKEILKLNGAHIFSDASNMLIRTRETRSQAKSEKRSDRMKNMQNAFFSPSTELARGCTAVIIDDVTTTGATFVDARRALKSAGARSVIACAIAH